jgi:hypothetical protein
MEHHHMRSGRTGRVAYVLGYDVFIESQCPTCATAIILRVPAGVALPMCPHCGPGGPVDVACPMCGPGVMIRLGNLDPDGPMPPDVVGFTWTGE